MKNNKALRKALTIPKVITGNIAKNNSLIKKCERILDQYSSGRRTFALIEVKRIQKQYPLSAQVNFLHAMLLYKENKFSEAYVHIKELLEKTPNNAARLNLCGLIERSLDKFNRATASYLKAIELQPEFPDPYNNLGILYRYTGQSKLAIEYFKKSLEIKPDYYIAIYNLSCVKDYKFSVSEIKNTLSILKEAKSVDDKSRCGFALYNSYSKLQDYKKAFKFLDYGNKVIFKSTIIRDSLSPYVKKVIDTYDIKYRDSLRTLPPYPETPVFIVGMPRSGSSLLEQILVSHPSIQGVGENQSMLDVMSKFSKNFEANVGEVFESLAVVNGSDLQKIAQAYRASLKISLNYKGIYTDKTLANYKCVGFIKILFPNAKFIHIKRNPVDVCFGCYEKKFTTGHHYSYDFKQLAKHYIQSNLLMDHWKSLFPNEIYDIGYEALVTETEEKVKACLGFLGLEMNAACLNFHNNTRDVITASTEQVREKISAKSVGKWRKFQTQLKPLIKELHAGGVEVND